MIILIHILAGVCFGAPQYDDRFVLR